MSKFIFACIVEPGDGVCDVWTRISIIKYRKFWTTLLYAISNFALIRVFCKVFTACCCCVKIMKFSFDKRVSFLKICGKWIGFDALALGKNILPGDFARLELSGAWTRELALSPARYIGARRFTYVFWYTWMTAVSRASDRARVFSLSANKQGSWPPTVSRVACRPGRDCTLSRCRRSATLRDIYVFLESPCGEQKVVQPFSHKTKNGGWGRDEVAAQAKRSNFHLAHVAFSQEKTAMRLWNGMCNLLSRVFIRIN